MIIICEPQCKGFSHEKFNSGFIYGLRLAFPNEKIVFFTHRSHIRAIRNILVHDEIVIENIEYVSIRYGNPFSILGYPVYWHVLKSIFSFARKNGSDKVFFLSYSPMILFIIKKITQAHEYVNMKFTLVLHGGFEDVARGYDKPPVVKLVHTEIPKTSLYQRFRTNGIMGLVKKIFKNVVRSAAAPIRQYTEKRFQERDILLWRNSSNFKYIALAPHIKPNASKYMNMEELKVYDITLPTVFEKGKSDPQNDHIKFAVFGYGDSLTLYNVALLLSQKKLSRNYEIRIIGMDARGTDGFSNVTCPSPGRGLSREEMANYAADIDMFLILYGRERYRLSCSGSILEALSYRKPIIHFRNDCIEVFDTPQYPIGYTCEDLEGYVARLVDLIENYPSATSDLNKFRTNIDGLRAKYSISNSVEELRSSFTW
jgi:hypothetical protein